MVISSNTMLIDANGESFLHLHGGAQSVSYEAEFYDQETVFNDTADTLAIAVFGAEAFKDVVVERYHHENYHSAIYRYAESPSYDKVLVLNGFVK